MDELEFINKIKDCTKIMQFDENTHKYSNITTKKFYVSVTELIKKYKPIFDENKWSKIIAQKRGITQLEVLSEWKTLGNEAVKYGNILHLYAETNINNTDFQSKILKKYDTKLIDKKIITILANKFDAFYNNILKNDYYIKLTEVPICSSQYNIAGTPDLLCFSSKTHEWTIYDYKTGTDLFKDYNEYMLPPINILKSIPIRHYELQISLYCKIIELITGIIIKNRYIVLFNKYSNENYTIYSTKDNELMNNLSEILLQTNINSI